MQNAITITRQEALKLLNGERVVVGHTVLIPTTPPTPLDNEQKVWAKLDRIDGDVSRKLDQIIKMLEPKKLEDEDLDTASRINLNFERIRQIVDRLNNIESQLKLQCGWNNTIENRIQAHESNRLVHVRRTP